MHKFQLGDEVSYYNRTGVIDQIDCGDQIAPYKVSLNDSDDVWDVWAEEAELKLVQGAYKELLDPEAVAIQDIIDALSGLEGVQIERVLRYICDRHNMYARTPSEQSAFYYGR